MSDKDEISIGSKDTWSNVNSSGKDIEDCDSNESLDSIDEFINDDECITEEGYDEYSTEEEYVENEDEERIH